MVKRTRPRVGDLIVVNNSGRWHEVTEVLTDYRGQWEWVGTKSLDTGLPNAFRKGEFVIHHHPRG